MGGGKYSGTGGAGGRGGFVRVPTVEVEVLQPVEPESSEFSNSNGSRLGIGVLIPAATINYIIMQ